MPNFIKMDSKPFHPDTYVGPEQEDDDATPSESLREKSMSIKLKVENTVRWRWLKDELGHDVSILSSPRTVSFRQPHGDFCHGNLSVPHFQRKQSNSKIVRWSDGSLSLQLGKELFDITQTVDTSGALSRQSLGPSQPSQQSQSQSQPPSQSSSALPRSQGLTYLVAQHKRAEILQCEALITGYMSIRPTGMQSETHRMLVRAVGQKHSKVARLRMAPDPTIDPERERMELLKQAAKKPKKPRGEDDGFGGARRRRSYARKRTGEDMWSDDDEEEEDFGEGGSDDEFGGEGSARKKPKLGRSDQDNNGKKGPGEYQTDDFVVADSDEEDANFGESDDEGTRKRTRPERPDEEEVEDDLEKLEAKIDQQAAAERKRRQRGEGDADGGDDDKGEQGMDIESEDEDEDLTVRRARAAPGVRKKRAIGLDDEEE